MLISAHGGIASEAFFALPTRKYERRRNPLINFETYAVGADLADSAGELMSGNMRRTHIRICSHPGMPIGSAYAACLHLDNHAVWRASRLW